MEAQHVIVANGVDDSIDMQCLRRLSLLVRFTTKQLCRRAVFTAFVGIDSKDRCSCEAEHHIAFHTFGNQLVHFAKLTSVTLVEYQYDILFLQHLTQLFVLVIDGRFHQVREFLYRSDDDMTVVVFHLFLQHPR